MEKAMDMVRTMNWNRSEAQYDVSTLFIPLPPTPLLGQKEPSMAKAMNMVLKLHRAEPQYYVSTLFMSPPFATPLVECSKVWTKLRTCIRREAS